MSEEVQEQPQSEDRAMRLVIEMVNGNVRVTGPITDRGLCYMMLELAKDSIHEYALQARAAQRAREVQIATEGQMRKVLKH